MYNLRFCLLQTEPLRLVDASTRSCDRKAMWILITSTHAEHCSVCIVRIVGPLQLAVNPSTEAVIAISEEGSRNKNGG